MKCSECPEYNECSKKYNLTSRRRRCPKAKEEKVVTNADRIRAMRDEELAEFLNRVKEPCGCCQLSAVDGACTETLCDDAMEEWLKQPVEDK